LENNQLETHLIPLPVGEDKAVIKKRPGRIRALSYRGFTSKNLHLKKLSRALLHHLQ
jgi:hypothetical protein